MQLIIFNFNVSDFISNPQIIAAYRTQTIFNSGGDPVTDNTKITSEDESVIRKYLKLACTKVADAFSGYTENITDTEGTMEIPAYEFDVTYKEFDNQIVYRINMPDTFITGSIEGMDESIRDFLENYIIFRINKIRGVEYESYKYDSESAIGDLRCYLGRRTAPVCRDMRMF
jgi:hypothetical protein